MTSAYLRIGDYHCQLYLQNHASEKTSSEVGVKRRIESPMPILGNIQHARAEVSRTDTISSFATCRWHLELTKS